MDLLAYRQTDTRLYRDARTHLKTYNDYALDPSHCGAWMFRLARPLTIDMSHLDSIGLIGASNLFHACCSPRIVYYPRVTDQSNQLVPIDTTDFGAFMK